MIHRIALRLGDITSETSADAAVTAANTRLAGGGGVDGAIHRAAGPDLLAACREIGGCPPGEARVTGAGRLPARHVIHAVGPVWSGGQCGEPVLLASCHACAIALADRHGCATIAFPAISTGAYGYPVDLAADVAITATSDALAATPTVTEARFWLFGPETYDQFAAALSRLERRETTGRPG